MSEVPNTVEETQAPVASDLPLKHNPPYAEPEAAKPVETEATAVAATEPSATEKPSEAEATIVGGNATPVPGKEEAPLNKSEAAVEATPASEGILGYKAPALLP